MKKGKFKKKSIILIAVLVLFVILLLYSVINIIIWYSSNNKNALLKKEIEQSIEIKEDNDKEVYNVDFDTLKKKNADTVAYLKVFNTNIDYVVVKGKDNDYYLTHNFNKEWNVAGWIFADYHNKFNNRDKNIVIYGHNTKNGSMFGSLHNVLEDSWYKNEDNQKILFITEDGYNYYQVFSLYTIEREDYYISTEFNNDKGFDLFVKTLKSRSIYDFNVDISGGDQILTLSTCAPGGLNRVVVHAKKISETV